VLDISVFREAETPSHLITSTLDFSYRCYLAKKGKCLGVILHRKLTYSSHVHKTVSKANHGPKQLYHILNKSSSTQINLVLTFCNALTRPTVTYAAPAWGYAAKPRLSKPPIFQNKLMTIITDLQRITSIEILHEQTSKDKISAMSRN
jgi:hypothetical protein